MKSSLLTFKSEDFPVVPGEDEQTNPGIFGQALANWLAEALRGVGVPVGEVIPEDFGWCIPVATTPHSTYVACANYDENEWSAFVFAEGGILSRIFGKDGRAADVSRISNQVYEILSKHPGVKELQRES